MKIRLLLLLIPVLYFTPVSAQQDKKAEKAIQLEKQFEAAKSLVESQQFKIDINRVYPRSGKDVSRFNPRGTITITDSIAKGELPFFGEAYSLPYGEGGGVVFDGVMKNQKMKTVKKKKSQVIQYNFGVAGKGDVYQFSIEIYPGGNCLVNLSSNNRTQISYSGQISSAKTESPQK